jgi:hypothetical protein
VAVPVHPEVAPTRAEEALRLAREALERARDAVLDAQVAIQQATHDAEDSPLLSVKDTAALLQCHRVTVHTLIERGLLDSRKIGGRRYVLRESVLARKAEAGA